MIVIGVALGTISATLLLPNRSVLSQMLSSDFFSLSDKIAFIFNLLGSLTTNFTLVSASYLILVSFIMGLNIALLVLYIKRRQLGPDNKMKTGWAGIGGTVSAILGIGCASCGSIIITSVLGIAGGGALVALLPFQGYEFGVIGLVLLTYSIYYLTKKINDPLVCKLD
jgi:hypothetical protein